MSILVQNRIQPITSNRICNQRSNEVSFKENYAKESAKFIKEMGEKIEPEMMETIKNLSIMQAKLDASKREAEILKRVVAANDHLLDTIYFLIESSDSDNILENIKNNKIQRNIEYQSWYNWGAILNPIRRDSYKAEFSPLPEGTDGISSRWAGRVITRTIPKCDNPAQPRFDNKPISNKDYPRENSENTDPTSVYLPTGESTI